MTQQRIGVAPHEPPDPRKHECDWCRETAVHRFEIRKGRGKSRTQMYMFACGRHKETGEVATGHPPD